MTGYDALGKWTFHGCVGILGAVITYGLGGWDTAMQTLIILMAIDFILGLITAGIFHKSSKSDGGALDSRACYKGLVRKGVMLMIVLVAVQIDRVLGTDFVRDATIIAFCSNESLSIIENAGLCGVPIPQVITDAIEVLRKKGEEKEQ